MKQFNLEEYLANPSRKVVTRDGRDVKRILCTDLKSKYPIVVVIENHDGTEQAFSFTKDGKYLDDCPYKIDLFFASEKHEGWVNILKCSTCNFISHTRIFESKEKAEEIGKRFCEYVTTIKIEWEE